jgi:hypothetical protein
VCAGMPDEEIAGLRPLGQLTIAAQGTGISVVRGKEGDTFLWHGQRWLSGRHNPPGCMTLCDPPTGVCKQPPDYVKGEDFDYWIPLSFSATGAVNQFAPFVDKFTIDLKDTARDEE